MKIKHLSGVQSHYIQTERLLTHLLSSGDDNAIPIIFIHGNFSSSTYFEELMVALPKEYRCLAVDIRGYGLTEDKVIDATRGARDWADDIYSLCQHLSISSTHLVGWSAGAAAAMQFMLDHPEQVRSLTLIAPVSPFGFGGSKDPTGSPCYGDFAGSGGGVVPAEFIKLVEAQDRSSQSEYSPRNIIRNSYFFNAARSSREDDCLSGSLSQKLGAQRYPGDFIKSPHWPFVAPGKFGPLNAVSGKYLNLEALPNILPKPPILWVRGDKDIIIDNQSLSDPAVLGKLGLLPNWPGIKVYPPQPMLDQTRHLLNHYQKKQGYFKEVVMRNVGHTPFIENQKDFLKIFLTFLTDQKKRPKQIYGHDKARIN